MARREERLPRVWAALEGEGIEALVVAGKGLIGQYGTLEWCAGYVPVVRGAYAVLTPGADPALVVTTAADAWYARRNTGLAQVRVAGLRHVMSSWEAERLAAALPRAELVDVSAQVSSVKAVKDPEDIEELRATAAIADTAFAAFLERVAPEVTGWEL